MASRRKRQEADYNFRETIGQVLNCITADGLTAFPGYETPDGPSRTLGFYTDRAQLSRTNGSVLYLNVEHGYIVTEDQEGESRVRTVSYIYTIFDQAERRILGWHYHPTSREGEAAVPTPHLHVYRDLDIFEMAFSKLHIPTSRVAIEDVVLFLVQGLGVVVRPEYTRMEGGEPRWMRILHESRAIFLRMRSWA